MQACHASAALREILVSHEYTCAYFEWLSLQAVAKTGLRPAEWPEEVEGTYLRMDVPHIVPHLLKWLEGQKPGAVCALAHAMLSSR